MTQFFLQITIAIISAMVAFTACFCYFWKLFLSENEARAVSEAIRMFRTRDGEKSPTAYRLGKLLGRHGFLNKDFNDDWRDAAMKVGERLSPTGPDGYYDFTADQWLEWAKESISRNK